MNLSELVEDPDYQEASDDTLLLGSWIYYVSVSKPGYGIALKRCPPKLAGGQH